MSNLKSIDAKKAADIRISAAQNMQRKRHDITGQGAFTLIEIMVTVAIIGVMVAMIGVSLSSDSDRIARLESQRFHAVVNEVRDEAILTGHSYFLRVDTRALSYSFVSAVGASLDTSNTSLFKLRTLKPGINLNWKVLDDFDDEDEGEHDSDQDKENDNSVLISSLGEITPFELEFEGDSSKFRVSLDEEYRLVSEERQKL